MHNNAYTKIPLMGRKESDMRKLYSDFKLMLQYRQHDHFPNDRKMVGWIDTDLHLFPVFERMTKAEIDAYFESIARNPWYYQFKFRYVNRIWCDESNWKIAYDVWNDKGKEYNKITIQTYHRLLDYAIPYINLHTENGKRLRCDKFLFYGIDSAGFRTGLTNDQYFRAVEFAMAVVYDMNTYL